MSRREPCLVRKIEGLGAVAFDLGLTISRLGQVGVEIVPKPSEWAIVVKGVNEFLY